MHNYTANQPQTQQIVEFLKHAPDPVAATTAVTVYAACQRARLGTLTDPERHRIVTMVDAVLMGLGVISPG